MRRRGNRRKLIDQYGKPDEITDNQLTWHNRGPWKHIVATKQFYKHNFPAPHIDSFESFIDYRVPVEKFTPLAEFDGSVIVERTAGEVSARCHDEQANFLALNLMNDKCPALRPCRRREITMPRSLPTIDVKNRHLLWKGCGFRLSKIAPIPTRESYPTKSLKKRPRREKKNYRQFRGP
jgi:hypothetical protein